MSIARNHLFRHTGWLWCWFILRDSSSIVEKIWELFNLRLPFPQHSHSCLTLVVKAFYMILWPDLNQPIFKEKSLANNWIITSHSFHATWQMVGWENKETRIAKVFLRRRHHSLQAKFMPRQNLDICTNSEFYNKLSIFFFPSSYHPFVTPVFLFSLPRKGEREVEKWLQIGDCNKGISKVNSSTGTECSRTRTVLLLFF